MFQFSSNLIVAESTNPLAPHLLLPHIIHFCCTYYKKKKLFCAAADATVAALHRSNNKAANMEILAK